MKITAIKPSRCLGRHPQPASRQGRDRRGHVRLGRSGPLGPREGRRRRRRALRAVPRRQEPDADRRPLAGDVPQPVFRGRPRARRRRSRRSTSRSTTSRARRWACRCYELLGGKQRDRIPTFATTAADAGPGDDRAGAAAGRARLDLHPLHRRRAGVSEIFEPREIDRPRRRIGARRRARRSASDVVLGIDYHHRLSVAEAASFCQKMPRGTLDFLEEPIRDETPDAYEALRRLTDVPFAIGEEFSSKWQFLPYIERDIHQFNRIDLCNVGGLTEAMKVAAWSEAHYVDLMPHNPLGPICTAATVHFCGGGGEFLLARMPLLARRDASGVRFRASSSPCSRSSKMRTTSSRTRRASASRSTRRASPARLPRSGRHRICIAGTAPSRTGRRSLVARRARC